VKARRLMIASEVEHDIASIATYLAGFSIEVAFRFQSQAHESIDFIKHNPTFGSPKQFRAKQLAGFRTWWIKDFKRYLILYHVSDNAIKVVAVTHGSKHLPRLLKKRV